MSCTKSAIIPTNHQAATQPLKQGSTPQTSGLVLLPAELYFKILGILSMKEFGCLNQTCKQISFYTTIHPLTQLLSQYFPNFQKSDPTQPDLEALKEQYLINSNLRNGVYVSHTLQKLNTIVYSLVLDGQRLYSGSLDRTIKIWDLNTNTRTGTLQGHNSPVSSLALGGRRLFSGSLDRTIKIWDLNTNTCTATLHGHNDSVRSLASSGQRLFSGSLDGTIKIWDLSTNTCTATLHGHDGPVTSLALDGQRLYSGSLDTTIMIWDLTTYARLATLKEHAGCVSSLALDGQRLFSGSLDSTIKLWDLNTNTCTATLDGHASPVSSLAINGQRLFSGSNDRTIKIWDLNTNACTATLEGHNRSIRSLAMDGHKLYSSSYDRTIKVWDFNVTDEAVLNAIAALLKSEDQVLAKEATARFHRMPPRAKNAIYGELYQIMAPFANDYFGCAEHAFHNLHGQSSTPEQRAQAISQYLTKKS
ncbi:MAG: WD40 repeat domain-containing protein [Verrucomicrobia bacterium]|nr:WD40 repeat domain-containing protein [Verrucomicrobiota bacterium]